MRMRSFIFTMMLCHTTAEMAGGQEKLRIHTYADSSLQALAVSRDGKSYAVVASCSGGTVRAPLEGVVIHERKGGQIIARPLRVPSSTRAVTFSQDGKLVAFSLMAVDANKILYMGVRVAALEKDGEAFDLRGPRADVDQIAFAPDGKQLAASQVNGVVFLWDLSTKSLVFKSDEQSGETSLTFAQGGRELVAASWDRSLLRWEVKAGKLLHSSEARRPALATCYAPDGKRLLVGTLGGEIEEWGAEGKRPKRVIQLAEVKEPVNILALSPDGKRAATVYKNSIVISGLPTGKRQTTLAHSKGYEITHLAFSGDGAFLLSGATKDFRDLQSEVILWGLGPARPKE